MFNWICSEQIETYVANGTCSNALKLFFFFQILNLQKELVFCFSLFFLFFSKWQVNEVGRDSQPFPLETHIKHTTHTRSVYYRCMFVGSCLWSHQKFKTERHSYIRYRAEHVICHTITAKYKWLPLFLLLWKLLLTSPAVRWQRQWSESGRYSQRKNMGDFFSH